MKNRFEITRDTLIELNLEVPEAIIDIIDIIAKQKAIKQSRKERNSLVKPSLQKLHLSIKTDGQQQINLKKNRDTFVQAIEYIGADRIMPLNLKIGRHPIICIKPKEIKKYQQIHNNLWVYISRSSTNMKRVLDEICKHLNLNWEITLVKVI